MYPKGRAALLEDPAVADALQQVATGGWQEEARRHAQAALAALADRQPEAPTPRQNKHVMLSYNWGVQPVVERVVRELQVRGYRTWFDLDDMTGNTVDAMSEAVDNAAVMLSCMSLACKLVILSRFGALSVSLTWKASLLQTKNLPVSSNPLKKLIACLMRFRRILRLPPRGPIRPPAAGGHDSIDDGKGVSPNRMARDAAGHAAVFQL